MIVVRDALSTGTLFRARLTAVAFDVAKIQAALINPGFIDEILQDDAALCSSGSEKI